MFKKILAVLAALMVLFTAAGCSEADKVNHNISQQAEYFQSERRVTVWNARTDNVIMYVEGYINISNNSTDELVITAKVGVDSYKKTMYTSTTTLYTSLKILTGRIQTRTTTNCTLTPTYCRKLS